MFVHFEYKGNTIKVRMTDDSELVVEPAGVIDSAKLNAYANKLQPYVSMLQAAVMYVESTLRTAVITSMIDPQPPEGTIQ